jgi:putative oxidoreductase
MVGYGFLEHGYAKLAPGPDVFISILDAIGTPFLCQCTPES